MGCLFTSGAGLDHPAWWRGAIGVVLGMTEDVDSHVLALDPHWLRKPGGTDSNSKRKDGDRSSDMRLGLPNFAGERSRRWPLVGIE